MGLLKTGVAAKAELVQLDTCKIQNTKRSHSAKYVDDITVGKLSATGGAPHPVSCSQPWTTLATRPPETTRH